VSKAEPGGRGERRERRGRERRQKKRRRDGTRDEEWGVEGRGSEQRKKEEVNGRMRDHSTA